MNTPQKIVVTGASGWLGRRLVEHLVAGRGEWFMGHEVASVRVLVEPGIDFAVPPTTLASVEVVHGDLRRPDDCHRLFEGYEGARVIHTAGIIHPQRIADLYAVNVQGTMNLFEAARAANCSRFVAVSSNSPTGVSRSTDTRYSEDSPYRPYMNYGRSKMQMEQALLATGTGPAGLVIVRAPWFYGPGQPPRQTLFFKMIEDGKFPVLAKGRAVRSMTYIDNLVQGLMLAAFHPQPARSIYWIADEAPYTMAEVVRTVSGVLADDFGRRVAKRQPQLPGWLADVAQVCDAAIQSTGRYHQKMHVLSEMNKTIACSVENAKQELGYRPTVALREGMKRSVQWCMDQELL